MGLAYILFHFAWDAPYFVRYLLPVFIFFILGFIKFIKDKNINYIFFNIIFFTMLIGYALQVGYQINNLGEQRGPYQEDSVQLFEYVVNSDYQPLAFILLEFLEYLQKAAYRLDTNLVDDSHNLYILNMNVMSLKIIFQNTKTIHLKFLVRIKIIK